MQSVNGGTGSPSPKRILVVDDEPELVRALGMRLSGRGYQVTAAYDGVEAMARICKDRPDLILLDIHLPAGNGYKICERIRSRPGTWGIPVIAITADPRPEAEQRCRRSGCAAFFRKPYDPHMLLDAIERALPGPPGGAGPGAVEPARGR